MCLCVQRLFDMYWVCVMSLRRNVSKCLFMSVNILSGVPYAHVQERTNENNSFKDRSHEQLEYSFKKATYLPLSSLKDDSLRRHGQKDLHWTSSSPCLDSVKRMLSLKPYT